MPRILLALQYWDGDRERAEDLARFLTDVESEFRGDADFLISARADSAVDPLLVEYVSKRFKCYSNVGTSPLRGYPDGSFGLWNDTIRFVRDGCRDGKLPRYDCILTFEADCVPLVRNWIDKLLEAWRDEAAPHNRIAIGQHWGLAECPYPHINGNLLVSGKQEHLEILAEWQAKSMNAWDVGIYPLLRQHGAVGTAAIASFYVRNAHDRWKAYASGKGAVFFHGDKDGTARAYMRHVLLGEAKPGVVGAKVEKGVGVIDFSENTLGDAGDGVWRYKDEVVSVAQQGFRTVDVHFQDDHQRRFNPGLLDWGGRLLLAYRMLSRNTDGGGICITELNRTDYSAGASQELELPGWGPERPSFFEDPRLFQMGGKLFLSYALASYFPHASCVQKLVELDPLTYKVAREIDLSWIGGNTGAPGQREKNWTFFEDGGRMKCVYSLSPHVVYDVQNHNRHFSNISHVGGWSQKYGTPRGGTPPVQVGNVWYSFFHSCVKHKERRRRYFAGVYAFQRDGDKRSGIYLTRAATRRPLLTASTEDGFLWPQGACFWEPVVIFPSGAHFDVARQMWIIAAGVNDCFTRIFEIPHAEILRRCS